MDTPLPHPQQQPPAPVSLGCSKCSCDYQCRSPLSGSACARHCKTPGNFLLGDFHCPCCRAGARSSSGALRQAAGSAVPTGAGQELQGRSSAGVPEGSSLFCF